MTNKALPISRNWSQVIGTNLATHWIFGATMSIFVLFGGCTDSGVKPESAAVGSGGQAGVQGSGGASGGVTANGGSDGEVDASSTDDRGSGGIGGAGGTSGNGGVSGSGGQSGGSGGAADASDRGGEVGGQNGGQNGGTIGSGGATGGGVSETGGLGSGGVSGIMGTGGVAGSGGSGGRGGSGSGVGGSSAGGGGAGGSDAGGSNTGGSGTGGNVTGGTGGSGGGTGTSLVALANAFCTAARNCCAKSGLPTSLGDCEAKFPSRVPSIAFVNKGTVTIDNTALAACTAAYNQTAATCAFSPLETACRGVFVGTKAEGVSCGAGGVPMTSGSGECKAGGGAEECVWTGDSNDPTVTGVCHTPPHGKNGDPCDTTCESGDDCTLELLTNQANPPAAVCFENEGLYCKSDGKGGSNCAPILPPGGSCADDSMACGSTGYCDSTGGTPKCKVAGTIGQSCATLGTRCLSSLVCAPSGKCADQGFAFDTRCSGTPPFPY
jgi:hypothetical protein